MLPSCPIRLSDFDAQSPAPATHEIGRKITASRHSNPSTNSAPQLQHPPLESKPLRHTNSSWPTRFKSTTPTTCLLPSAWRSLKIKNVANRRKPVSSCQFQSILASERASRTATARLWKNWSQKKFQTPGGLTFLTSECAFEPQPRANFAASLRKISPQRTFYQACLFCAKSSFTATSYIC